MLQRLPSWIFMRREKEMKEGGKGNGSMDTDNSSNFMTRTLGIYFLGNSSWTYPKAQFDN